MAEKKIKLSIAGQEVTCNFGINYFYKHFNEATGVDMLVEGLAGIGSTKMFDLIPGIYYAGYRAECSLTKSEPKLTKEDFDFHVLSADETVAAKMINDYVNTINPPDEKKAEAQTETP